MGSRSYFKPPFGEVLCAELEFTGKIHNFAFETQERMWWYNLGIHAYSGAAGLAAPFKRKAKLWKRGRRDIFERLKAAIPAGEKIVWIHSASLGEFEQGRPVIEAIRREKPEYKILLTFFSPSGYEIRKDYKGADWVFYLPADTQRNARRFLDIVNPEIAIFIKYEFWLNYLTGLQRRSCRTFIVSAIFRRDSIFFRPYGRSFRNALKSFEHLFVQNENSRELLRKIGIENVTVAGDTRFDRVWALAQASAELPVVKNFAGNANDVFIAGSTWPADEEILLQLINENPAQKFIVAPHEMDEIRIEEFVSKVRGGAARYTESDAKTDFSKTQVLVIDTIGILSAVYRYGAYGYIGGGFGAGIHNTLEAVTFGLPVAFGPNYKRFKEANELVELGVGRSISSCQELADWLSALKNNPESYANLRQQAFDYIGLHKGATTRVMERIFS